MRTAQIWTVTDEGTFETKLPGRFQQLTVRAIAFRSVVEDSAVKQLREFFATHGLELEPRSVLHLWFEQGERYKDAERGCLSMAKPKP